MAKLLGGRSPGERIIAILKTEYGFTDEQIAEVQECDGSLSVLLKARASALAAFRTRRQVFRGGSKLA